MESVAAATGEWDGGDGLPFAATEKEWTSMVCEEIDGLETGGMPCVLFLHGGDGIGERRLR